MIVPSTIDEQITYRSAVSLEHYARAIEYSECQMYGVYNPAEQTGVGDACRDIWTLDQRNYILRYLTEAQVELEDETRRLFSPTWITGNLYDTGNHRLLDVQTYKPAVYTKWNNVIAQGRKVVYELALSETVDHTSDPALIGPITIDANIVQQLDYVKIFYPGTELEINPSKMYLNGLDLYIEVPRCRMVEYSLRNNPSSGVLYTDVLNFQQEVDIVYWATEDLNSSVMLDNCTLAMWYLAGEINLTQQQIDMIIRLAHSKMPDEPCGCERAQALWKRDRNIPDILTAERLNNPFGINDGAHIAWRWSQSMKKFQFGYLGGAATNPARDYRRYLWPL